MKVSDKKLKSFLNNLYKKYKKFSSDDPIWFLENFKKDRDIEIIGFIASCYSYGQIGIMNNFLEEVFARIGKNPFEFVLNSNLKKNEKLFKGLKYRFNNEYDLINLIENIRINIIEYGSLEKLFLKKYSADDDNILKAMKYFSDSLRKKYIGNLKNYDYLMPDVSKNSTCKRLNLFLRWMVRKDEIDPGIWSREVDKSKLIMPVDVHVYRVSRKLKLVKRTSCDMKFAIELTEKLKRFDPNDPVKYDFALCHNDI